MKVLAFLVLALSLAACYAEPPPPAKAPAEPPAATTPAPPVDTNAITSEGWGPLRIGMTRAEVTAAVGATATPNAVGGPDPESCDLFHPANAPEGMLVMLQRGSWGQPRAGATHARQDPRLDDFALSFLV